MLLFVFLRSISPWSQLLHRKGGNGTDRPGVNRPQQAFNKNFISTTLAIGDPALCGAEQGEVVWSPPLCSEWSCLSPLCSACGVAASAEHPW